jgi:hypothetical protein
MLKKATFLFLLKICTIFGLFGQKKIEISLFLYPNEGMEFQTLKNQERVLLENNPNPFYRNTEKNQITFGFTVGLWSKNRFLLQEIEFNSRQIFSKKGKDWVLPPVPFGVDSISQLKNWRVSGQYAIYFNPFPANRRCSFYPGLAIRPIVAGYKYTDSSIPVGFEKIKSSGIDLILCPRIRFKFSQKWSFEVTMQVLNLENRVVHHQKQGLGVEMDNRNFVWNTKFLKCVTRFGLTFRF